MELELKSLISVDIFPFGIGAVKPKHILTYYAFGKCDGYRTIELTWIPLSALFNETFCGVITLTKKNMHLTYSSSNPIRVSSFVIYNIVNQVNNHINLDSDKVLSNRV